MRKCEICDRRIRLFSNYLWDEEHTTLEMCVVCYDKLSELESEKEKKEREYKRNNAIKSAKMKLRTSNEKLH